MKRFFSSSKVMLFLAIDIKKLAPNSNCSLFKLPFTYQIVFLQVRLRLAQKASS